MGLTSRARPGIRSNPLLLTAIAGTLALQLPGIYLAPLRDLLGTHSLTVVELLFVGGLPALGYPTLKIVRRSGSAK